MKIFNYSLILFFVLSVNSATHASELSFATSSSSMVEELSQPTPMKMRGITRGFSKIEATDLKKTRGLKLIRVKLADPTNSSASANIIEEHVKVATQQTQPHVNLKIEFDVNAHTIRPSSYLLLSELSKALQNPKLKQQRFYINGHTDSDGDQNYNLMLSINRALAVKQYLTAQSQITADRLTVMGYGEYMPLQENSNRLNKQLNRRVEIVVR